MSALECEDQATQDLVKSIIDLFPAKRHLAQALADLLLHYNERDIDEKTRLHQ